MRATCSAVMPMPWSRTTTATRPARSTIPTSITPPSGEYLRALPSTLVSAWRDFAASARIQIGVSGSIATTGHLAESIGAVYKAPHGAANAVFLGPVLNYYGRGVEAALAEVARSAWPSRCGSADDGIAANALVVAVSQFVSGARIGTMLELCGGSIDVELIANLAETNNSNASGPVPMSAEDYARVIRLMA